MKKIIFPFLIAALIPFLLPAQNSWEKKTSFLASKRARAVAFAIGQRGYLATGEDTLDVEMNDLWEYDPGSDSWTQKANLPGVGRRDAVGFAIGNKGYVGTGIDAAEAFTGNTLSDFYEYSPATNTWTTLAPYPGGNGGGIYFATGFVVSGKGYVCCGKFFSSNYSLELWAFDPATNSWANCAGYPGGTRYGQVSFTLNNRGYVGTGTDENWFVSDFYSYNPVIDNWAPVAPFPSSARSFATAFTLGNKAYVGMGTDGGYRDDWYEYDPVSDSWNVKAPFGGEGRRSAPAFVISGAAYVMTGKGNSGKHRDCWQYMPYTVGMDENAISHANVFPNPASEYIHIEIDETFFASHENLAVRLYSTEGKLVAEKSCNRNSTIEFRNENWNAGMYFYTLSDNQKNYGGGRIEIRN